MAADCGGTGKIILDTYEDGQTKMMRFCDGCAHPACPAQSRYNDSRGCCNGTGSIVIEYIDGYPRTEPCDGCSDDECPARSPSSEEEPGCVSCRSEGAPFKMNTDREWLLKMAEREDGKCVSVGGLVTRIEQETSPLVAESFIPALEACLKAEYERGLEGAEQRVEEARQEGAREASVYRVALEEIKEKEGRVCEEFEICQHEACRSSCSAWMIADKALKEARGAAGS